MSAPIANPAELVLPTYERAYGMREFPINGGQGEGAEGRVITVASQPTWESFFYMLRTAPPRSLGEIALGPELITSPGPLAAIPSQRERIEHRVGLMQQLSEDHPTTTFVFGTATFDDSRNGSRGHRPANSVVSLYRGEVVGQHNKQYPSPGGGEKDVFTFQQEAEAGSTGDPSVVTLVCADIIGEAGSDDTREMLLRGTGGNEPHQLVGDDVTTVLVSSSWATPVERDPLAGDLAMHDERFRNALEIRVGKLFERHPQVRELVIADRVPAGIEGVEGPYSAHFASRVPQAA